MQKYGVFDVNGLPMAFYSDDVNQTVPVDAIRLTDAQWSEFIENAGLKTWNRQTSTIADAVIPLEEMQAKKNAEITQACANAIKGGFSSSALGNCFHYASQLTDQANLIQTANSDDGGGLWRADDADIWAFITHSQAQAQRVLADFNAYRNTQQQHLAMLIMRIGAATTADAIDAICWESAV